MGSTIGAAKAPEAAEVPGPSESELFSSYSYTMRAVVYGSVADVLLEIMTSSLVHRSGFAARRGLHAVLQPEKLLPLHH